MSKVNNPSLIPDQKLDEWSTDMYGRFRTGDYSGFGRKYYQFNVERNAEPRVLHAYLFSSGRTATYNWEFQPLETEGSKPYVGDSLLGGMPCTRIYVFEQMWCVDWLLTVTVYTKQTTGCPRWDWGASDTLILPYTFSLSLQPAIRQGQRRWLSAACSCCRMHSHWTGLDWTGRTATPVCPPRARGVYSLAYMLQGRLEQTRYYCEFVFDVLKYSYSWTDNRIKYSTNWLNQPLGHNAA